MLNKSWTKTGSTFGIEYYCSDAQGGWIVRVKMIVDRMVAAYNNAPNM